jgi:hypothetical protein
MSPGSDGEPNPLIALFRRCVVGITDEAGRLRGSGFFVTPGRVVTCGHVAHGAALRLQWQGNAATVSGVAEVPPLDSVADPGSYQLPDLAVLTVDEAAGWGHPCAALAAGQPALGVRDGLYLAGYTVERGGVLALTGATTEFESMSVEDGHGFFKLKRRLVLPGLSGSPLLDLRSGRVVGITRSTRSRKADPGEFAVPVSELAAFPGLLEASHAFHDGDDRWQAAAEAEKVRAAQRAEARGRLPLQPPVVPLAPDADPSMGTVLRPPYAVVGYVGREQLLGELAGWCEREPGDGSPVGLWLVTGGGGSGKTRLAMEACREAEARGWTAGLLRSDVGEDGLRALAEWPGRLLIAVDYAESNPVLVRRLEGVLAARAGRSAARMMLLVRHRASRAELPGLLNPQREEELDALLRRAPVLRLADAGSEVDRLQLYRRAAADLAPFLGTVPGGGRAPRLRAAHFARPLYVLAAACLASAPAGMDVDALGEAGLLRALLDRHEAGHWERLDKHRGLGLDPAARRAAVAVATLLGADRQQEALAVVRLVPHLGGEPESRLIAVARWLAELYPPPGDGGQLAIGPLEPNRLGEVLVGDVLRERPGLLAAAIDAASDRQLSRALTVTARIARHEADVSAQLRDVLDDRLPGLMQRGISAGDGGGLLASVTTAMTVSRPFRGAAAAAGRFPDLTPVWLRHFAVAVTTLAVDGLRAQAGNEPASAPTLAILLNTLATHLSGAGRPREALESVGEAVMLYRQLAQDSPDAYLPDLATSLNTLATHLSGAGRPREALESVGEAVTLYRQLAQDSPDAYLPDLATSLNTLATHFGEAGRWQEGVEAAGEAVTHYRQLAQDSPDVLPDLAASLSTLAASLGGAGRWQEGVEAAGEAVTHYRQLAQDSPDVLPDLAASLSTLAASLGGAERWQEALEPADEAVTHYRRLAQDSPDALLPDLAASLNTFAGHLSEAGLRQEALQPADEAVTLYRQLARNSPGAYLPVLAASLNTFAGHLSEAGLRQEALQPADEAVTLYRQLTRNSPDAYLPVLATSLNTFALHLSRAGRRQEALEPAGEAVTIRRQLAQASTGAYHYGVAAGFHSEEVDWRQEALEALEAAGDAVSRFPPDRQPDYLPLPEAGVPTGAEPPTTASRPMLPLETAPAPEYPALADDSQRYLRAQCPERVRVGETFSVLASIVREARKGTTAARLDPFPVPPAGRTVVLVLDATGLEVLSRERQEVCVPFGKDSDPVMFELRAADPGPVEFGVTAWADGTFLGRLDLDTTATRHHIRSGGQRDAVMAVDITREEGAVSLVVRHDPRENAYRFEFRDEDNPAEVTCQLAFEPGARVEQLISGLDALARGRAGFSAAETRDYLANSGIQLWTELIPAQLREQFWERQGRISQLTILSDSDMVPWELLYPLDQGHDEGFLVEQFPVTRVVFGRRPARSLRLDPAWFVVPQGSPTRAYDEITALSQLLSPAAADPQVIDELTPLLELVNTGNFGLLHFACHNTFDALHGSAISLDRRQFTPLQMNRAAVSQALARHQPTVFINACRSAGMSPAYHQLDGWAQKFLAAGAGAFIGSLWAVRDSTARDFASELYRNLQSGTTFGEAVRQARLAAANEPGDPTWLAYAAYGDPRATI